MGEGSEVNINRYQSSGSLQAKVNLNQRFYKFFLRHIEANIMIIFRKITSDECVLFSSANTWKGTYRKIRLNINNRNSDDDEVDHSTNQILIELCTRTYLKLKPTCEMYFTVEGPPTYVGPSPLNYSLLTLLEKLKTVCCTIG